MNRMRMTCGDCCGSGGRWVIEVVSEDVETGICTSEMKKVPCISCNGTGYTEYAVFTIEEATQILKHCGLEVDIL